LFRRDAPPAPCAAEAGTSRIGAGGSASLCIASGGGRLRRPRPAAGMAGATALLCLVLVLLGNAPEAAGSAQPGRLLPRSPRSLSPCRCARLPGCALGYRKCHEPGCSPRGVGSARRAPTGCAAGNPQFSVSELPRSPSRRRPCRCRPVHRGAFLRARALPPPLLAPRLPSAARCSWVLAHPCAGLNARCPMRRRVVVCLFCA